VKSLTFCLAMILMSCTLAFGQTYKVLYNFQGSANNDGAQPYADLLLDQHGDMFGTTATGGTSGEFICTENGGCGTVFELSPNSDGSWKETVLYSFCLETNCPDGRFPLGGLVRDAPGNLYGTTVEGSGGGDYGNVFELSPPTQGGQWTERVLWSFRGNLGADGCYPKGKLVFDVSGNLYGVASACGAGQAAQGAAFELQPSGNGVWTEAIIHTFRGDADQSPFGYDPEAGLIFDQVGNLYGTTGAGGKHQNGVVYSLSPKSGGGWSITVLHAFAADAPGAPSSAVALDSTGNVYGTAFQGGLNNSACLDSGCGGLFKLAKKNGSWASSGLTFKGTNGGNPAAELTITGSKAYGTTQYGGAQGQGTIFVATVGGITSLYSFCSEAACADGSQPVAALTYDGAGHYYGVTSSGGAFNQGVVFEITP
jgi:uncharacterized repeat protein (TIGR03803 family)